MRLGALPLLICAVSMTGCFAEPDTELSTGGSSTETGPGTTMGDPTTGEVIDTTSGAWASSGSTFGGGSTGSGSSSGGSWGTSGGEPSGPLLLFPLACTEAEWESPEGDFLCGRGGRGARLETHETYALANVTLERVIDVRPVNAPSSPVDGYFLIDTSDFVAPTLRCGVACLDEPGCQVDYMITVEQDGEIVVGDGGPVVAGKGITELMFALPVASDVVIHVNLDAAGGVSESHFLWVDPQVVDPTG